MGIFKKKHAGVLNVVSREYEKSQFGQEPCEEVIPAKAGNRNEFDWMPDRFRLLSVAVPIAAV